MKGIRYNFPLCLGSETTPLSAFFTYGITLSSLEFNAEKKKKWCRCSNRILQSHATRPGDQTAKRNKVRSLNLRRIHLNQSKNEWRTLRFVTRTILNSHVSICAALYIGPDGKKFLWRTKNFSPAEINSPEHEKQKKTFVLEKMNYSRDLPMLLAASSRYSSLSVTSASSMAFSSMARRSEAAVLVLAASPMSCQAGRCAGESRLLHARRMLENTSCRYDSLS